MAKPVANLVQDAMEVLYSAFSDDKTDVVSRKGVNLLNEMAGQLNRLYGAVVDIAITDATDAGVSEFIDVTGEGAVLAVGSIFRCSNATNDLTDNALATAKGSAVAEGDVFVVDGADSVEYLGTQAGDVVRPFDMVGELDSDFDSIGS